MSDGKAIRKPCLRCGKAFEAENRFNRICPKCSKLNDRTFLAIPASGGSGRRRGTGPDGKSAM